MVFYEYFKNIVYEKLKSRETLDGFIEKIDSLSGSGNIGFYPSGKLTGIILNRIKEKSPGLLKKIAGCFDKSPDATTEKGINVYPLSELSKFKNISLLAVPSNTFFSKEQKDLDSINYLGKKIQTSYFDISLPASISNDEIIKKIDETYNLLSDMKSKSVYMMAWLSRLFNDETLTSIFEGEDEIDETSEPVVYKKYKIKGLDHTCKKELQSELYKMKYVFPEKGDTVLDIGAYKGDTSVFFADHIGETGKVYAFEPVSANMESLKENIKSNNLEKIVIPVQKGISCESKISKIVSNLAGAPWSYLSDNLGGEQIEITSVDDFVNSFNLNKLNYIKMDVEGLEEEVICGAGNSIKKFMPKMAIAIYHKTTDLITLPLMIKDLGDYDIYLRSKVEGPFGFTLYAKFKNLKC